MNRPYTSGKDSCVLVCGTLAYDHIGTTQQPLGAHNAKLVSMNRQYGGCGGNIAYNLAQLQQPHQLVAFAGKSDFGDYATHLDGCGVDRTWISTSDTQTSAQAFIFTAPDGDQFTAFYPAEVNETRFHEHLNAALEDTQPALTIVAPDTPANMLNALSSAANRGNVLWCPGQYAELLTAGQHAMMQRLADIVIVNAAEAVHLSTRARGDQIVVVTNGAKDVVVSYQGIEQRVSVANVRVADPTGCGDAFTAGFAEAWLRGAELPDACSQGIHQAADCAACVGSQNHRIEATP